MNTSKSKTGEYRILSEIAENWKSIAKQLKAKFPHLNDSDLDFQTDEEEELLGRIETRLGKNREEVIGILDEIESEEALVGF